MKIKISNKEHNWYLMDLENYTSEFLIEIIRSLVNGHFYEETNSAPNSQQTKSNQQDDDSQGFRCRCDTDLNKTADNSPNKSETKSSNLLNESSLKTKQVQTGSDNTHEQKLLKGCGDDFCGKLIYYKDKCKEDALCPVCKARLSEYKFMKEKFDKFLEKLKDKLKETMSGDNLGYYLSFVEKTAGEFL